MILGSMPSITSLEKQEYYGFNHNRFWKIMAAYFRLEFTTYGDKESCIKNNHLLLWDIIQSCEREGSLDSNIHHEICNDLEKIISEYLSVEFIICNGKKSFLLYKKYFSHLPIEVFCLPSTSNANQSIKKEELYIKWFETLDFCYKNKKAL